ncbi:amorpha-4,11-diene synthase [Tanacetum coccineum]
MRVLGEIIFEDCLVFTRSHVSIIAKDTLSTNPALSTEIQRALKKPIWKRLPRIEAAQYIPFYQQQDSHNKTLLKLAKLEFNLLQSLHKEELSYMSKHCHAHRKEWVRALVVETKWVNEGHIPTTEEHDSVASITGGANLLPITCYLGKSDIVTKEAVEWVVFEPPIFRYSGILGRRLNDVVSHKDEQERKHTSSSVESYMKEYNVNEEYAQNLMYKQVEDAWKNINREYLITKNIPRPLLMAVINMA